MSAIVSEPPDHERPPARAVHPRRILDLLDAGAVRAAHPDPGEPGGWRVDQTVKAAIIARFTDRRTRRWTAGSTFRFRDRIGLPLKVIDAGRPDAGDGGGATARIVPGGTSIRAGVHLGQGVVVMPPSFINVGAWIGDGAMIDSHVLVGSCAQIGDRVHLAAGVQVGGVLEPPGARPVIVEDGAFVGAGSLLLDGVLVGRDAVIGAGVTLTGTTRLYDLVRGIVLEGTAERPLAIPARAVVVPGSRALGGRFATDHGLSVTVPLLVKDRDARTDARVALEEALR
ncbi:MAG: 2,3,4,5-tetrahydropyridine-2,6-dicarboxylate N-succinyltransferase [Chloroflexi bacterium]|nr:2,3,4,5-tetrahydropyridine-2,6-dicarboxylate N-succinyltransferase [Chloroflexota bacterium]